MLKRLAFLGFLGLVCSPSFGQIVSESDSFWDQFLILNYGVNEGLISQQVYDIKEDEEGFIWLVSNRQFLRFDGLGIKEIKRGNKGGTFYQMHTASDGRTWIPSIGNGLYLFENDSLQSFSELTGSLVKSIESKGDTLFLGMYGEGLKMLVKDSVVNQLTTENGLIGNEIWTIKKDPDNRLWIGTNSGLSIFDGNTFKNFTTENGLPYNNIRSIEFLKNGEVWVGTDNEGIVIFKNGEPKEYLNTNSGLPGNIVNSILQLNDGRVLIGTLEGGISIYDKGEIETITLENGLISSSINSIYRNDDGILFIGTEDGLSVLVPKTFKTLSLDKKIPFRDEAVTLNLDGNNRLWLGTYGKGYRYLEDDNWVSVDNPPSITNGYAQSGTVDSEGNLWIGTQGSGVFKIEGTEIIPKFTTENGLHDNYVRGITFDHDGNLWIGSNKGITVYNPEGKQIASYSSEDEIPNPFCITLVTASDGSVWYGSFGGGVVRFKDNQQTIYNTSKGLRSDQVLSIFEDSEKNIWVGTFNYGISKVQGDSLITFGPAQGMPEGLNVAGMLEDEKKNLWLATGNGILRIPILSFEEVAMGINSEVDFIFYNKNDGLISDNLQAANNSTVLKNNDGSLLFASIDGVSFIDPSHIPNRSESFSVYIDEVIIEDSVSESIDLVSLTPNQKRLAISFSAINYFAPNKTRFRIKLDGIDDDWVYIENRKTAYYDYLPDGNYTFHVSGIGPDGQWSEKTASLDFTVLPPFYKTWWFIALCLLGFVGIGAGGVQIRSNMKLQALNRELETQQKIQKERERISRELHDNVGSQISNLITGIEISNLHVKKNQQDEALSLLENLDNDARGAMTDLRETIWLLDKDKVEFGIFLEHLNGYLKRQKRYLKNLEVEVKSTVDPQFVLNPARSLNLTRIIQEALNNTNKYAEASLFVIECGQKNNEISILLSDNGKGMDTNTEIGAGNGLINMRERAKLMEAEILIESKSGKGTTITVLFS